MLQEVNNLRVLDACTGEERELTGDERRILITYLSTAKKRSFDDIRKKLKFLEGYRFNFERAERKGLQGIETEAILGAKKCFGKNWFGLPEELKNEVVRKYLGKDTRGHVDEDEFVRFVTGKCNVDEETALRVLESNLPEGFMNFSLKAIEKLLPHLEEGLPLMADDDTPSAMREAGYLRPDQRERRTRKFLPQPPDVTNPIVRQSMREVRKVVNSIIREHGKPARIHIELAREAKGSQQQRKDYLLQNKKREEERKKAAERIEELGHAPTRDAVDRYLLWKEQQETCIYSGRPISCAQLFAGEIDVDHILPRQRSLDNSMANKAVCFRSANADKGDRTPYEWLAETDAERYDARSCSARENCPTTNSAGSARNTSCWMILSNGSSVTRLISAVK